MDKTISQLESELEKLYEDVDDIESYWRHIDDYSRYDISLGDELDDKLVEDYNKAYERIFKILDILKSQEVINES